MVSWSALKSTAAGASKILASLSRTKPLVSQVRHSGGHGPRTMVIQPSRWQYKKFKDFLHFYTFVGLVPVTLIITYANIFIGPAKLAEIPEGYTPKHWEYYQHPITRFLAQYVFTSPQQEYEKHLHFLYDEDKNMKIRKLTREVEEKMREREDYQAYYFVPMSGKYHRIAKQQTEEAARYAGINPPH